MVQRKLGIKPHHLKSDAPQSHDLKKIMKKPRPTFKNNNGAPPSPTPNYMKSTTSFDARKEPSPKTPTPKNAHKPKPHGSANSGRKALTTSSSLKVVRTLTKSSSFKPSRPLNKRSSILREDLDAQRATCSSTLKDTKFPNHLELTHGGTELEGTSAMKVCPYSYCSLNGHHHPPVPPLKCFLSARRRAMKTQKSFKFGCLSPRQIKTKPVVENNNQTVGGQVAVDMKGVPSTPLIEEESRDLFVEIYSKDSGCSDIDWEEGYGSDSGSGSGSCLDDEQTLKSPEIYGDVHEQQVESFSGGFEESYDEESVSSGAWLEDGDYESDGSYQQTKIDHQSEDQSFDGSSKTTEADVNDEIDKNKIKKDGLQGVNLPIGDQQQEEASKGSQTLPDFESDKRHTIIYNIIQFNISVFVNGVKTDHSETDKGVVEVPATTVAADQMETEDVNDAQDIVSNDKKDSSYVAEKQEDPKKEHHECEASKFVGSEQNEQTVEETEEEHKNRASEVCKERASDEELQDPSINLRGLTRVKKLDQETDDSKDFNPRGPNFLPEMEDPDTETVNLRHQMMDERRNAEEWMVDFALQQAVTTLAPARKRKVALLVEAFEKVMPIPKYETRNTAPKVFANARPMQACS